MERDYQPFGEEWKKEMMKLNKQQLIAMLGEALQTVVKAQIAYKTLKTIQCKTQPNA